MLRSIAGDHGEREVRLRLDNADLRDESFDQLKTRLAKRGIEVIDITRPATDTVLSRDGSVLNDATRVARQLHDELNIAKHHPTFWVRWHGNSGRVSTLGKNEQYYSFYNSDQVVTEVLTDQGDLESHWSPLLPKEGDEVQDQRFAVPIDYQYKKERTAEEIQDMVSRQQGR